MKIADDLFFSSRAKIPVFLSSEMAECGLACLAMIGNYYGHDIDLNSLRQRFSVSAIGANLKGVMTLADKLGLSSRALRVDIDALDQVSMPAIVHWDMNHFVVLKSVGKHVITIIDPARGELIVSREEFSNHFTGVVLELTPGGHFEKLSDRRRFRLGQLFTSIRGHRVAVMYVLLLSVSLQLLAFALPFQMQLVVDKAIIRHDGEYLLLICVAFGALVVLNAVISALRDWTMNLLSSQFVYQVAGNIFRHVIRLPAEFFEKRHLGDIMSRIGAVKNIQDAITQGGLSAIVDGSMVVLSGIAMTMYSPTMATIVFASVLASAVITVGCYPMVRDQSAKSVAMYAAEQTYLMESLRGAIPIKLMGAEAIRESAWRNLFARSFNIRMSLERLQQKVKFTQDVILGLQLIVIIYLGASRVLSAELSLGMFLSFLAFRAIFTERVQILTGKGIQVGSLVAYVDRLGDILVQMPEVAPGEGRAHVEHGDIHLRDVSFRYGRTDPFVFEGINLEIQDGSFTAIIGASGGGKTTLLKLLLGLHQPSEGGIYINGEFATPAVFQAWRTQIGVVRQDDQLFSGTLAENIASFDPELDMRKVLEASMAAQLHNEIERLPTKYMTPIGDMGSSLSGGQKQRLLLARALYRSPKVLILDEGTANLDPANESILVSIIAEMKITRIVVAHRPALVERAHRVIKVEAGKVEIVRE